MYVKSRESATTVVHMGTRVDILQIEKKSSKKISTVRTEKRTETPLKNFTARESMVKNAHTVTRRVTNKRSYGRKKYTTKKRKRKRSMLLNRYITTSSSLVMTH